MLAKFRSVVRNRLKPQVVKAEEAILPVNYRPLISSKEEIARDARYAVNNAVIYAASLPGGIGGIPGKSVIEFGPGLNFGTVLVLRAWGARAAAVADRFLVKFDPNYHVPVYTEMARILREEYPETDLSIFDTAVSQGHAPELIREIEAPLEEFPADAINFDVTLSNAVFEHFYDPHLAISNLYRSMANGGVGSHQVDFRDHRDFSKPLEFLLMDEVRFVRMFDACHCECGNRVRPTQMGQMFLAAGFSKVDYASNMEAELPYVDEVMGKFLAQPFNPCSRLSREELTSISGRYIIQK